MNVVSVIKTYITKMIEDSGPGMKMMLLDKQTTSIVSMVYSQSEILQKEVYLFERLDSGAKPESVKHLKCIVFIRPTKENINLLAGELKYPRYSTYYVYLSNIISKTDIKLLAESDEQEVVREVLEFYADYLAVSPHLFSLGISNACQGLNWSTNHLQRSIQGITSVLLSLKKFPIIRYLALSDMAKRLAEGIRDILTRESSLCNVGHHDNYPVLLILDRREDPVTPLLNQWSYQAMVHELLGINNDRVSLPNNAEMKEVVLSPEQDEFYSNLEEYFREEKMADSESDSISVNGGQSRAEPLQRQNNIFKAELNTFYYSPQSIFSEVAHFRGEDIVITELPKALDKALKTIHDQYNETVQMIKDLVDEFQKKAKSHKKVETIADMKNFVESYPQFSKMSGTATKHVNVIDEIFSIIGKYSLMDVSELEQDIVSQDDHSQHLQRVKTMLGNPKIRDIDATRLVLLYNLRYRRHGECNTAELVEALRKRGTAERLIDMVGRLREYSSNFNNDIFGENKTVEKIKKKLSDLKGVENVFTRHTPFLKEILEELIKGKLKESLYPYLNSSKSQIGRKVQDIIVFIVGGTTYTESLTVHQLNRTHARVSIVLGGTTIHNTSSFLDEVETATEGTTWKSHMRGRHL